MRERELLLGFAVDRLDCFALLFGLVFGFGFVLGFACCRAVRFTFGAAGSLMRGGGAIFGAAGSATRGDGSGTSGSGAAGSGAAGSGAAAPGFGEGGRRSGGPTSQSCDSSRPPILTRKAFSSGGFRQFSNAR